jgi:hypothetical protein
MQGSPSSQMKQEKSIMLGERILLVQILRSLHSTKYIVPHRYNVTADSGVLVPAKALLASPLPPPHLLPG